MDFALNDEQRALQDSVRRFVTQSYTFESRQQALKADGFNRDVWTLFAEQGWLAAGLPDAAGGFGGSAIETGLIAAELGRGLVLEPYVAVAVLAAQLLVAHTAADAQAQKLEPLLSGTDIVALAHHEPGQARCRPLLRTRAVRIEAGYRLTGTKTLVLGGTTANYFLVSARSSGEDDASTGVSLFQIAADHAGLQRQSYRLIDGTPVADITLHDCIVPHSALLGEEGGARAALEQAEDEAITALCAQVVGAMERAIEITTDYLRTRKQFGVVIGTFQALQHRLADMLIELEQSRAMVYRALSLRQAPAASRRLAVAAAKAQIGKSARFVGAQAIQLHGGIGVTEEYSIGHYFKFLTVAESLFGNTASHLGELARSIQRQAA